jgi:hypothetical protein
MAEAITVYRKVRSEVVKRANRSMKGKSAKYRSRAFMEAWRKELANIGFKQKRKKKKRR